MSLPLAAGSTVTAETGRRAKRSKVDLGSLLLLPSLVPLLGFLVFPVGYLLYLSLWNTSAITPHPTFVGLQNYSLMLADPMFWAAIVHTLIYVGAMLLGCVPLSLLLAFVMDSGIKGIRVFRTLLFLPYALPLVTSGIAFGWMFQSRGIVNWLLSLVHLGPIDFFGHAAAAMVLVIATAAWQFTGFYTVILFAGLTSIPRAIKEAARIDGAEGLRYLRLVLMPMLAPSLFFVVVVSTIQSLQAFDQIYVLTQGGPGIATTTLLYYIYTKGFQFYQFGQAAGASIILLVGVLLVTIAQMEWSKRWVHYDLT